MRAYRTLFVLPLLATTALALGCGDSGSPTDPQGESGTVSFSFGGPVSGSFNASGAVRFSPITGPQPGTWAAGGRDGNELGVVGLSARTSTRGDLTILWVDGATGAGNFPIDDVFAGLVFMTNVSMLGGGDANFDRTCWLETGSVSVSSLNAQRAQGSFSGQGVCVDREFVEDPVPFVVSGGQFDVPIIPGFWDD